MASRKTCPVILLTIACAAAPVSAADDCPAAPSSKAQHQVGIAPLMPRFGSTVDVTIVLTSGDELNRWDQLQIKALCFDSRPVPPPE